MLRLAPLTLIQAAALTPALLGAVAWGAWPAVPPAAEARDGGTPDGKPVAAAEAKPGPGEGFISEVDARVAVAAALGDRLFKLGRYDEAVAEYRRAYELRADPPFLYHIAECYRELGATGQALFYYERFLAAKPDAPERDEVLDKITELERPKGRDRSHPRLVIVPEGEPGPKPHPAFRPWRKWWFWTALGAAVAVGVTATLLSGNSVPPFPGTDLGEKRFY